MAEIVVVKGGAKSGGRNEEKMISEAVVCGDIFYKTHDSRQEWKQIKLILRKLSTVQPRMHITTNTSSYPNKRK